MNIAQDTPWAAATRLAAPWIKDGFELVALHEYTDPSGTPLYWTVRAKCADTGEKRIRPMMRSGTRYRLKRPEFPNGGPLYRLFDLARRDANELVVFCEGENCVDALLEKGILAVTSGSTSSVRSADLTPIAGRNVLIWPDNDDAGLACADKLELRLRELGCTVRTLDPAQLGLASKGDAVDWLLQHPEADANTISSLPLRADDAAPHDRADGPSGSPAPPRTAYRDGWFEVSQRGVEYVQTDSNGARDATWVCSPLRVLAMTRNSHGEAWGRLIEWHDSDGRRHVWAMPMDLLESDGADVRRQLANCGLSIAPGRRSRDLLLAYLKLFHTDARVRCVDKLGWDGDRYITPDEVIGDDGGAETVVYQSADPVRPAYGQAGTVGDWIATVARLAAGNSRVVFAISTAFAAPLLDIVGAESGGFLFRGASSSGKSTALIAAASVMGPPKDWVRTWRATLNGLEGTAAAHNDNLTILDEIGQCSAREVGDAAYLLANGKGKLRANRNGSARATLTWRGLYLSSGEQSLAAIMTAAGRKTSAGQEVRLADIEADAGQGLRLFEQTHGLKDAATLSLQLKEAASASYGTVGAAWLRRVVEGRGALASRLNESIEEFVTQVTSDRPLEQQGRVARRFGLVAAAGELATEWGLTGWVSGEATRAAAACYQAWLAAFGASATLEDEQAVCAVRDFLEKHGSSRFQSTNGQAADRVVANRAGFVRVGADGPTEYLIFTEVFRREVCDGLDYRAVERVLIERGYLIPGGDRRPTQKPRLPGLGTNARVYVVSPAISDEDA